VRDFGFLDMASSSQDSICPCAVEWCLFCSFAVTSQIAFVRTLISVDIHEEKTHRNQKSISASRGHGSYLSEEISVLQGVLLVLIHIHTAVIVSHTLWTNALQWKTSWLLTMVWWGFSSGWELGFGAFSVPLYPRHCHILAPATCGFRIWNPICSR